MPYQNVWDETAPLDTSLASLLGQDIRTFKLDIRQRLAGISGTAANMPTPEAVFAGLLYFATDTGRIFSWSGTAWNDVTSTFIPSATGGGGTLFDVEAPGSFNFSTASSQPVFSLFAPLPPLAAGHGLRLTVIFQFTTSSPNVLGAITYGASGSVTPATLYAFTAVPGNLVDLGLTFTNTSGTQAQQVVTVTGLAATGTASIVGGPYAFTLNLDTTTQGNLEFAVQSGSGATVTGSVAISAWLLELI